jgi:uncharacterized membrane protein YbhN (UPF0104 family)
LKELFTGLLSLAVLFLMFYILVLAGDWYNKLISYAWQENPMMVAFLVLFYLFFVISLSFSALVILVVAFGEATCKSIGKK